MSENPNKLIRYWQELRRRKVFSVVTTYIATAYIIIEATNNLVEPLSLPAWIAKLVILLLGAGFPVVVILSWIFDITPKGIKKTGSLNESEKEETLTKPIKRKLRPSYVLNAILIVTVVALAYPKIFKPDILEKLRSSGKRISIAVMPFQNMTNDTAWNVWQEGIQNEIIASLTNSEELKVRQIESITSLIKGKGFTNYASITPSVGSLISKKLGANVFIYGSIKQVGNTVRVNTQLIDSKTEEALKSFQIDGTSEKILHITDSLSMIIRNFLVISKLEKEVTPETRHLAATSSPEAYRYFISGSNTFMKRDFPTAVQLFSQAIAVDSNFTFAALSLSIANGNQGLYEEAKKWCLKAYNKRDQMPNWQKIWINWVHAIFFETPKEEIKYLMQLKEFDDQFSNAYSNLGYCYNVLNQYNKAIPEMEKVLEMYYKWGIKPSWVYDYTLLGYAYHKTGQYKKEKKLYKKAEKDFPDDPALIQSQAVLSFVEGDTILANQYIEKYRSLLKANSSSESDIGTDLASIYSETGNLSIAEDYHRKSLLTESENQDKMNNLAYFLIDKNRNISEGLQLVDKALELHPNDYSYLHTKGLGLYKQGKYKEAIEILQKSWDFRIKNAIYDHEAYLHLEAAKKAVASQKSN